MLINTALLCLALNTYMEARGEPIMGQYAVAQVTLNRAGNDPKRVCREVFKPKQFSWTIGNVQRTARGWQLSARLAPRDAHAWWVAMRIAKTALGRRLPDFTGGATHYHATYVKPRWRLAMVPTKRIGQHRFYTLPAVSQG